MGYILGSDVLCKAMGGSCFIQRDVADYIVNESWDVAIFERGYSDLYYIRGKDIVTDFGYLLSDLIHPSPYGHAEMGRKIASIIRKEFKLL